MDIEKVCVICHEPFILDSSRDSISRIVCYKPECLKVFRFECGRDNRYWRTKEQRESNKRVKLCRERKRND